MRGDLLFASLATAFSLLPSTTNSLELVKRSSPAVFGIEIERRHVANPVARDRLRRRETDTVDQELENEKMLYLCNITLGTPPQELRMHIDTGSSDLWVNTPNSKICRRRNACEEGGTFDAKESSTYEFVSDDFNISYVDGSGATGDYVKDTMEIAGVTLEDFQFAIGLESTSDGGVLGIGYPAGEVQATRNDKKPYANLPQALVDEGYIKSNAYSLWLNDLDANKGEILFGGVNTAKFEGTLETIPILPAGPSGDQYLSLVVALTGISLMQDGAEQDFAIRPIAVALDSGTSLSYLPDDIVAEIYESINAIYSPENGMAFLPCDEKYEDQEITFTFSDPQIVVRMDELVINIDDQITNQEENADGPRFSDGSRVCAFGIAPAGDSISILGDTVLRSAYVVYDLENHEISLAQTRFNITSDAIVEIGTGSDSVPDATGVASAVSSAPTTQPTGGPGATSTAAAAPTPGPDLTFGVAAGLAGAGIMFVAI